MGVETVEFGTVVRNFDSKRVPLSSRQRAERQGSYPYYGAAGVIDYVDAPLFKGLHLLIGEDGSVVREDGTPYVQLADGEFWVNNHAHVVRADRDIDTRYVYYALQKANISSLVTGAVQPKLTQGNLNKFRIPYPKEETRDWIVGILGTLDDKIELNRRMAATLEEMARAIFKSWFIDFDPVRAKSEGHPTNLPSDIDALFPDSFQDSAMDLIPVGWSASTVAQMIELNPTRTLKKGQVAKYLDMSNVRTAGPSVDEVVDRAFGSGTKLMNGDTLLARITPCLENGKTALVDFLEEGEVGWGSTEFVVMKPRAPLPEEFAYCLARDDKFREFAIQSMTGSSGRQRVQAEAIGRFRMAEPSPQVAEAFALQASVLFSRISSLERESKTLEKTRDALLPKLISWQIVITPNAFSAEEG